MEHEYYYYVNYQQRLTVERISRSNQNRVSDGIFTLAFKFGPFTGANPARSRANPLHCVGVEGKMPWDGEEKLIQFCLVSTQKPIPGVALVGRP